MSNHNAHFAAQQTPFGQPGKAISKTDKAFISPLISLYQFADKHISVH